MESPRWKIVMRHAQSGERCVLEASHTGAGFSVMPHPDMVLEALIMVNPSTDEEHIVGSSDWKVELSLEAEGDMFLAAQECPIEVGGRHRVVVDAENGLFRVPQIWIPSQVCSEGGHHLSGIADYEAMLEAQEAGHDWSEFRIGQWHSHVGGTARLSGTDLGSTQRHMEFLHNDWVRSGYRWREREIQVEFVINNRRDISARFSSAVPIIMHFPLEVVRAKGVTDEAVRAYMEANRHSIHQLVYEKVRYGFGGRESISLQEYWACRRELRLAEELFRDRDRGPEGRKLVFYDEDYFWLL